MVFLFLLLDEILDLHEYLVLLTPKLLDLTGYGKANWSIPFLIVTILLFLRIVKFLNELPKRTLKLHVLVGIIFILGSVSMGIIGSFQQEINESKNITNLLFSVEDLAQIL